MPLVLKRHFRRRRALAVTRLLLALTASQRLGTAR
jgi:hypothetical protein